METNKHEREKDVSWPMAMTTRRMFICSERSTKAKQDIQYQRPAVLQKFSTVSYRVPSSLVSYRTVPYRLIII